MNGGTFTTGKEKERAGIYFNFKTTAQGGCRSVNGDSRTSGRIKLGRSENVRLHFQR